MASDGADRGGRTRGANLLPRILVGVIGIPLLAFAAVKGQLFLLTLVDLLIVLGLWEFYRLLAAKGIRPHRFLGIGGGLFLSWQIHFGWDIGVASLLALFLLAVMAASLIRPDAKGSIVDMAGTLLGTLYVGLLSSSFLFLRDLPGRVGREYGDGGWCLLAVFILTWVYDTGAYGVGLLCGKHLLLPRVSPRKSVEGAVGGLLWALLAGWLLGGVFLQQILALRHFLVMAVIVSVASPLGDLAESLMKRDAQIKDSSRLLPGHGGVLDRFDSLLFIVPTVYLYLRYVAF